MIWLYLLIDWMAVHQYLLVEIESELLMVSYFEGNGSSETTKPSTLTYFLISVLNSEITTSSSTTLKF